MKLRRKIILVTSLMLVISLGILYASSSFILFRGFRTVENNETQKNVQRVEDALGAVQQQLYLKATDWSVWDDDWNFVQKKYDTAHPAEKDIFATTNLVNESIGTLQINFMIFVNNQGQIVTSKGVDYAKDGTPDLNTPDDLKAAVTTGSLLINNPDPKSSHSGVITLSEGPLIVVSRPIVHSDGTGPVAGTLIFAKYLDDTAVKSISQVTNLNVKMYSATTENLPQDIQSIKPQLTGGNKVVKPNGNNVDGYDIINDIYGKPAAIVKIETDRSLYRQGVNSTNYFVIALLIIGIIFGAIVIFLLERAILGRVFMLTGVANSVTKQYNYAVRMPVEGKDELTQFAEAMNRLLDELQLSLSVRAELDRLRRQFYGQGVAPGGFPVAGQSGDFGAAPPQSQQMSPITDTPRMADTPSMQPAEPMTDVPKSLDETAALSMPKLPEVETDPLPKAPESIEPASMSPIPQMDPTPPPLPATEPLHMPHPPSAPPPPLDTMTPPPTPDPEPPAAPPQI